jgi:hypothetical protein
MKVAIVHDWLTGMRGGDPAEIARDEASEAAMLRAFERAAGAARATDELRTAERLAEVSQFAERAAAHEEVFLGLDPHRAVDADPDHDGEVTDQYQIIPENHARRSRGGGERLEVGRSLAQAERSATRVTHLRVGLQSRYQSGLSV